MMDSARSRLGAWVRAACACGGAHVEGLGLRSSPRSLCPMSVSRRQLLLVGCGAALGCGSAGVPALLAAGNISDLPQGTVRAVSGFPVAIGRDGGGIYALSLLCTHAGCDISADGSVGSGSIECFCHGSVFSGTGEVLRGPAAQPLPHFVVTSDASGALTIHTDETTAASTRLPA